MSYICAQKNHAWCILTGWVIVRLPQQGIFNLFWVFFFLAVTHDWSSLHLLTKASRNNSLRPIPVLLRWVAVRVCIQVTYFGWILQILSAQERILRRDAWGQWRTLPTCGRTWKRPCPACGEPKSATGRLSKMVPTQRFGRSLSSALWQWTYNCLQSFFF